MKRFVSLLVVAAAWMTGATAQAQNPVVILDTSKGKIVVELDEKAAPISVKNFLKYVEDKHYDGTIFHRVIPGFMVQTGGMTDDMREKPTRDPIKNESTNGLQNRRGTLAMARTGIPDSATSQFFVNVKDNAFLDKAQAQDAVGYAVFGRVIEGMDVVDAIVGVPTTTRGGHENVPETAVYIRSARRK
jgi:peptidyl-prolyl cis-trans isomerase A (cyclophilin A)